MNNKNAKIIIVLSIVATICLIGIFLGFKNYAKKVGEDNKNISASIQSSSLVVSSNLSSSVVGSSFSIESLNSLQPANSSSSSSFSSSSSLIKENIQTFADTELPDFSFKYDANTWSISEEYAKDHGTKPFSNMEAPIFHKIIYLKNGENTLSFNFFNHYPAGLLQDCISTESQILELGDGWVRVRTNNGQREFNKSENVKIPGEAGPCGDNKKPYANVLPLFSKDLGGLTIGFTGPKPDTATPVIKTVDFVQSFNR